jgi:hypothetical protein
MPKHDKARAAQDERVERVVHKLAHTQHAPAERMHRVFIPAGGGLAQSARQKPGSGDDLPQRLAIVASFPIAFEEWSTTVGSPRVHHVYVGGQGVTRKAASMLETRILLSQRGKMRGIWKRVGEGYTMLFKHASSWPHPDARSLLGEGA